MTRENAGIRQFYKPWYDYDWIMHHLGTVKYPYKPFWLGKYLELTINGVNIMTANTLQYNGEVVYSNPY